MAYLARDVAVVFGLAVGAYAVNSWCAHPLRRAYSACLAAWTVLLSGPCTDLRLQT